MIRSSLEPVRAYRSLVAQPVECGALLGYSSGCFGMLLSSWDDLKKSPILIS